MLLLLATALATTPADLAAEVEASNIDADLRMLCGEDPLPSGTRVLSRHVAHPHHEEVTDWLEGRLEELAGFTVDAERFDVAGFDAVNLVAELPGKTPDAGWVVLGAHYDSTASLDNGFFAPDDDAPGADDDASGVSAVLEAGRILGQTDQFEKGIRLVLFDAEEEGLLGAYEHVSGLSDPTDAVLIMDPVGYNPGGESYLWFAYGPGMEAHKDAMDAAGLAINTPLQLTGVDAALIGGDERSDHFPFWQDGRAALHAGSFPQPPAYHTQDDTYDVVDTAFLTEVTRLATGYAAQEAELRESGGACGCSSSGGSPLAALFAALLAIGRRRRLRRSCTRQ